MSAFEKKSNSYFPRMVIDVCFLLIPPRLAVLRGNSRDEIFYLDFCIKRRLLWLSL